MRTGVLSNSKIIGLLNEQFVNVFVLLGDLPEFQNGAKGEPVSRLATTISTTLEEAVAQHKIGRSVNTFILSPELELISHLPYRKPGASHIDEKKYETFLKDALAALKKGKNPGLGSTRHVALNAQQTSMEILNIFRAPGHGNQDYTTVEIDTTPFENGGKLTIDIWVGNGEVPGSFDLFAGDTELPTTGMPDDALASAWEIEPGMSRQIVHPFDRGQLFKLGVTGNWASEKGQVNAFWAKISVEPNPEPEPRKVSSARQGQSAEDVMNAFVKAFKNLDSETIRSMLIGDARETFASGFEDIPEDMRPQMSQMLRQMEIVSSEYVGDEFHFRLRVPTAQPPEVSVKMRKVEGIWRIYDAK